MQNPTSTLINDIITLALGKKDQLRSNQLDRSKANREKFFSKYRRWARSENVISLDVGPKIVNGLEDGPLALRVWVRRKQTSRSTIGQPIPMVLRDDAFPDVITDVVELASAPGFLLSDDSTKICPGATCSKNGDIDGTGTIACIGRYGENYYGVTAGHVFGQVGKNGAPIQVFGAATQSPPFVRLSAGRLSRKDLLFEKGKLLQDFDAAAFELRSEFGMRIDPRPYGLPPVHGIRHHSQLSHGDRIMLYGGTSRRLIRGSVYFYRGQALRRGKLRIYDVRNCIDTRWRYEKPPELGDSGSLVIDDSQRAIGFLLGGGFSSQDKQRFVAPIAPILEELGLSPIWS